MADDTTGGVDLLILQAVLEYCKNWFQREILLGTYTIASGRFAESLDKLQDGQYYRIIGSVFNDGLHQQGRQDDTLTGETFDGAIWVLAVPGTVIALAGEIETWQTKYGDAISSPYSMESFGGYTYQKSAGTSENTVGGWQFAFRQKLNQYRKL